MSRKRLLNLLLLSCFVLWLPEVVFVSAQEVDDSKVKEKDDEEMDKTRDEGEDRENDIIEEKLEGGKEGKHVQLEEMEEEVEGGKRSRSLGFLHGFLASISVIIVSEIGDKTFFIAAILAMKYSRWLVFSGALSALGLMTFLSVCLGFATLVIPRAVTFYVCTVLLALFGFKLLYDGWKMSPNEGQEEFEEVSEELRKREEMLLQNSTADPEQGLKTTPPLRRKLKFFGPLVSPIFLQAFSLTFLAEWGDRSQITTIILAARENPVGVTIGGTLGHALCTAIAVIGGKIVAQRISVRTVTIIGGLVFLLFAITAFFHDPTQQQESYV